MDAGAEVVRSLLGWAQRVVLEEESSGPPPGPRLVQSRLFRYLNRADPDTALAISRDLDGEMTELRRLGEASRIVRQQREDRATPAARSRQRVEDVERAEELLRRMRRQFHGEERRLLEQGSTARSWKALEEWWPGRVWTSLRDDFEVTARRFWDREKFFLSQVAEFVVRDDTMRERA